MLASGASIGLAIAGVINLLPVTGVLGASWLKSLYGLEIASSDLEILLRHRALLFGIVGVLLLLAVFRPALRVTALAVGAASMASFIVVALIVGGYTPAIGKIIMADVIGLFALIPASVAAFSSSQKSG
jgi:hypothetical protein